MYLRTTLISNLCLLAMLGSMQPQLDAAKHSKSADKKIDNLQHNLCKCSKKIIHDIDKLAGCDNTHVISHVPAVIDKPGKWCVKKDLVYNGSSAAITVRANNVTLNFHNHSLTLTNASAVGVYAEGVQEFTVENDIIQSTSVSTNPLSRAFYLVNCEKVKLDNIFTANTFFGVYAVNSHDVLVTGSRFKDHIGGGSTLDDTSAAIRADTCNAVVIEDSTFSGAGAGAGAGNRSVQTIFRDESTACRISNCEFTDIEGAVLGYGIDGLVVENCITQTSKREINLEEPDIIFRPVIQLGGTDAGQEIEATNVAIKNCLLNGGFDIDDPDCLVDPSSPDCSVFAVLQRAIFIAKASMILVDGCEIGNFLTYGLDGSEQGLIQVTGFTDTLRPHHITIRDCTIRGTKNFPFQNGIQFSRTDEMVIDSCHITGPRFAINVGSFSKNVIIRNSTIDSSGACAVIFSSGVEGVTITGNDIMNTGFNSLQIIDQGGNIIKNVTIEGNTISSGLSNSIYCDNTENVVIKNNIIDGTAKNGVLIGGSDNEGPGCLNTTIQGNTISSSGQGGIVVVAATNTMVQDNVSNFNGQTDAGFGQGIVVAGGDKTTLLGNSCVGNSYAGIITVESPTNTFMQNNTTTQNDFGIVDADAIGEVTAFFNKSCDNTTANCIDIPLVVAPGDPVTMGANLCCYDREDAQAVSAKASTLSGPGDRQDANDVVAAPSDDNVRPDAAAF